MSKVLIVENTALTALRLKMELESAGYGITDCVTTATKAIESLSRHQPDLVLLDFYLNEGEHGSTVADYIHAHYDIPIIYLSQHADDKTIQKIENTSFYAYFTKPFQPNALLLTIRQALSHQKSSISQSAEKVVFVAEHQKHTILADNILWIATEPATKGVFITTKTKESQFRVYETLKDFLKQRKLTSFVQISSSCIVNLNAITNIIGKESIVIARNQLPIKYNKSLVENNGNRIFKIGKTYKKYVSDWELKWLNE